MTVDQKVLAAPVDGAFCYLSIIPRSGLHPYGKPPQRFTDAKDPMLGLMRGFFADPYLVLGHIQWSDDVPPLAAQTKPYFQKMRRWIKGRWEPYGDIYVSPEAKELLARGAQMVNVLPIQATLKVVGV